MPGSRTSEIERLLQESPTDERLWALLMRAWQAAGDTAAALAVFGQARRGSSLVVAEQLPTYTGVHAAVQEMMAGIELGDPHATSAAIFAVVDAEEPPLRIFLGKTPQAPAKQTHAARIAEWDAWEPVSVAAFGR
jgi:hypothetical protein